MGMQYDVTFHDATIPPAKYGDLIEWSPEQVAAEPERAAALALEAVNDLLDDWNPAEQDAEGIHLDDLGYHDSASYGYIESLHRLLKLCSPGAYTHENDAEDSSGEQWRYVVQADGSLREITGTIRFPGMDWPEDLPTLIAQGRNALKLRGRDSALVTARTDALRNLLDALDPQTKEK